MLDVLSALVFISVFFVVFSVPKGRCTHRLLTELGRLKNPRYKLSAQKSILCYVPFASNRLINKRLKYHTWAAIDLIAALLLLLTFAVSTVCQFLQIAPWILLVFTVGLWISYLIFLVLEARVVYLLARLFDRPHLIIWCLLPPVGFHFLTSSIKPYLRKNKDDLSGAFDVTFR